MFSYERLTLLGRKHLRSRHVFWILFGLVFTLGGQFESELVLAEPEAAFNKLKEMILHFDQAAPGVYRGGLIPQEAVSHLKELGIKTVINFDNKGERVKQEEAYLKSSGISVIRIPWSGWDKPREQDMDRFLALMEQPQLRPIYVHCKRGSERTGTALAIWRIAELGWPADEAYEEMKRYEYRRFLQGHLKQYMYDYAREHGEDTAKAANALEQLKTSLFYFFFQLRKLNPFLLLLSFNSERGRV